MGSEHTFYDFIDQSGRNVIRDWLDVQGQKKRPKAKLNFRMQNLEGWPRHLWVEPYTKPLKGNCQGLIEIRADVQNVQYRLLGFHGPGDREVTLVFGAHERGGKFVPRSACEIALKRKGEAENQPMGRRSMHDFDD